MEEKGEAQKDFMLQWMKMQGNLWNEWWSLGQEMLSGMPAGPGKKGMAAFDPFNISKGYLDLMNLWYKAAASSSFSEMRFVFPTSTEAYENWTKWLSGKGVSGFGTWYEDLTKTWQKSFGEETEDGLGRTVFERITRATKMYFGVLDFWAKFLNTASEVTDGKPISPEDLDELREQWMQHYQSIMKALWGGIPSPQVQDMVKAFSSSTGTAVDHAWKFAEPVVESLSQLPEIFQKMAAGDTAAVADLGGLFATTYEQTMGKALLAPTLGYFREFQERLNKALYAYGKYATARTAFLSFLHTTGTDAAEKVFQRFTAFNIQEITPETFRELYRLWWSSNEEVYQEVFRSKEFIDLSRQMVEQGLVLRKWLDELSDQFFKFTSIPSKKDMDEIHLAIYETKKELREQKRRMMALEKQVATQKATASPGE